MFFVKLIVVLGGLGVILKLTSKWWLPLLNKFKTRPDENPLTTLLTWFNEPDKQDRRTAVGVLVVILMGLAMPLSRTVVWSGLGLIIIAGIAFWGIGLFAEEKVKKARQASFNDFLSKLVLLVFVANLTLYSLKAYGVDPSSKLQEWKQTAVTRQTKAAEPKPDKVFELLAPAGTWSASFEETRGKAPEKAISNCTSWKLSTDTGEVVRYTNTSGSKTGEVDSKPGRGPGPLLWSDLPDLRFQSTTGKEVTVKLTLHYD